MSIEKESVALKLKRVRLLALDVDGVLTDGKITYDERGNQLKSFHAHDGLGIKLLIDSGIKVAIISGGQLEPIAHRAKDLGIQHVYTKVNDKSEVLTKLQFELQIKPEETAYIGDDINDMPVLNYVTILACPCDANKNFMDSCNYIIPKPGGNGAVRDFVDLILSSHPTSIKYYARSWPKQN